MNYEVTYVSFGEQVDQDIVDAENVGDAIVQGVDTFGLKGMDEGTHAVHATLVD